MKVHNFPVEKRLELFNLWSKKQEIKDNSEVAIFDFGNDIYITPYQLQDPEYIIPEWNIKIPEYLRELYPKIGKLCRVPEKDFIGYFGGIICDYTDFYYRIVLEDEPRSILHSCVGTIDFID